NRLVGRKLALVDDTPGVTRDRRVHAARLLDLAFDVIDTAGYEDAEADTLEGRMRLQTEQAIADAGLILLVVDARAGLTPLDRFFAQWLRRSGKPTVLVANKSESRSAEAGVLEAYELGFDEPVAISAERGIGMEELRHAMVEALGGTFPAPPQRKAVSAPADLPGETIEDPDSEEFPAYDPTRALRVAVVGRPNAGKSTLINRLVGEERLLT